MILDIINKKRLGKALSYKELDEIFNGYLSGDVTDYQMSALLMAICINGMTDEEVESFLKRCENNCCCAEKVRILRKTRKALLDTIHKEQAVLDKLDNLIWNIEHGGAL